MATIKSRPTEFHQLGTSAEVGVDEVFDAHRPSSRDDLAQPF
jgi:hypothetical protein